MSEPGLRAIALDFGTSSLRRVRRAGADVRPVPDLIRGSVRTPAALAERAIREGTPRGAALAALGRAALADAVSSFGDSDGPAAFACVVAATTPDEEREAIRAAAVSSGFTAAEVISAPIALALAREEETKDRALWLVVDAGHAALRAHLVRWHTVSGRSFPRVEKTLREAPEPGGL
ncbi:hypothetical protein HY251_16065, partial [bacterium]|nr:hypothetical protein [bacterium]